MIRFIIELGRGRGEPTRCLHRVRLVYILECSEGNLWYDYGTTEEEATGD